MRGKARNEPFTVDANGSFASNDPITGRGEREDENEARRATRLRGTARAESSDMNRPTLRKSMFILFSLAMGVGACSSNEPAVLDGDDAHGDLETSFSAPNDDPTVDDDLGLESAEEAAVDLDGDLAVEAMEEIDVTDLGEDAETILAAKRVKSPVPGFGVTYPYGVKNPRYAAGFHTGQDHAAPVGRPVVAVRSGKIRWSNDRGGAYGRWIGLDADNGRTYVYCHLSKRRYKAGRRVKAGERIGRVGATGNVTGPHLHFEDHPKGPFVYAQVRKPRW